MPKAAGCSRINNLANAGINEPKIKRILKDTVLKLESIPGTDGIFVRSSYAVGPTTAQSDLDVGVIGIQKTHRETWAQYEIPVHIHYFNRRITRIIAKDERDPEFLTYLPVIKTFGNIIPLSDKKGVVASLQREVLKKTRFFARFHVNEMGRELNDAYGLFQKGSYPDAILRIREASAQGILTFLSAIGIPSGKEKYAFSLLSTFQTEDEVVRKSAREMIALLTKIHELEACTQEIVAQQLLNADRMLQILSNLIGR